MAMVLHVTAIVLQVTLAEFWVTVKVLQEECMLFWVTVLNMMQEGHRETMLQWCYNGVTMVLQWCHNDVTKQMLPWDAAPGVWTANRKTIAYNIRQLCIECYRSVLNTIRVTVMVLESNGYDVKESNSCGVRVSLWCRGVTVRRCSRYVSRK
jgi:hypothetical protein